MRRDHAIGASRRRVLGCHAEEMAAFTLLEVMLAIAIFASVLIAIYSTWTSILRSSQVAQAAAAEVQRSRMAARALEEALLGAQVAGGQLSRGNRQNESLYSFLASGDPDEPFLSFISRLPESFPRGGRFEDQRIRRLTFSMQRGVTGDRQLVLRQTPLLFEPDVDEEENPLILARDVQELLVEFWNVRDEEWQTEWVETNRLPPLIRFRLETGKLGAGRTAPPSVANRIIPIAGSGSLTGIRSAQQAPEVEPPPEEPPAQPPPGQP
jgi:type II secretion system protein J